MTVKLCDGSLYGKRGRVGTLPGKLGEAGINSKYRGMDLEGQVKSVDTLGGGQG